MLSGMTPIGTVVTITTYSYNPDGIGGDASELGVSIGCVTSSVRTFLEEEEKP